MCYHRGSFTPHNTIRDPPSARQKLQPSQQTIAHRVEHLTAPANIQTSTQNFFATPDSAQERSITLSELGNSSSLFSHHNPESFDFGGSPFKSTSDDWPVPFVFGQPSVSKPKKARRKMVNERSPAKAAVLSTAANGQLPKQPENSHNMMSSPLEIPRFGQPSMPSSPFSRPPAKESSMFIQPKSRPEHHRDGDRPGMLSSIVMANLLLTAYCGSTLSFTSCEGRCAKACQPPHA